MSTTRQDLTNAYVAHRREHGQAASLKIVKRVTGSEDLDAATEEQRQKLIEEFEDETSFAAPAAFSNSDGTINASAIFAKWNAAGRARGRTS